MSVKINNQLPRPSAHGPYETQPQAAADVADIYEQARCSMGRGTIAAANLALLRDACIRAGVKLGAFDTRILAWLADFEPEPCAVVVALITRAYAAGLDTAGTTGPMLDPYCQAGQHANCPGRLCQCSRCEHNWRRG